MDGGGGLPLVLLVPIVLVVLVLWWVRATRGMRPRTLVTALPPDELRRLFAETVATWSWRISDHGNPMVAASSPLTGLERQSIALTVTPWGEGAQANLEVVSYEGDWVMPVPTEPEPLLWRIDSFVASVLAVDPTARVGRS